MKENLLFQEKKKTMSSSSKGGGQYFTTDKDLLFHVSQLIHRTDGRMLEPSCGRGHLLRVMRQHDPHREMDMYEIDDSLALLPDLEEERPRICYTDFLLADISCRYSTIVGNPPYVRTRHGNLFLDFIRKCVSLLEDDGGELIFIVPSLFFKMTSASPLLKDMLTRGHFTHIYHPHREDLFENASIDVLIFRYCTATTTTTTTTSPIVLYNNEERKIVEMGGVVTFQSMQSSSTDRIRLGDYFHVHVGLVTGKDSVFKNKDLGNVTLLNGKNLEEKYIWIQQFPSGISIEMDEYMLSHKQSLQERRMKKFKEDNWFEWGAVRNLSVMENNEGKHCLYVVSVTRSREVCFVDKVRYFGARLLILIPKKELPIASLETVAAYLNSDEFQSSYRYSNRFKIGQRQLCNAMITAV